MIKPLGKFVYVASPYTHADMSMRIERFLQVVRCTGWLMNNMKKFTFFSPINQCHPIALECTLPGEWEFWARFDECIMSRCDEMWILCIPGWKSSTGVNAERKIAERFNLPIKFVIPQPYSATEAGDYIITETEPEE